eukprot:GHVS01080014.1.p1 GENE.GHVS01080014.1~~GHVS01080014.1.p1  ORF type:complete len:724 (-),score=268.20 GHVS01080014.1:343-2514(-)
MASSSSELDIPPLVFDFGTHTLRMGVAGDDQPRYIFPAAVGVPSSVLSYSRQLLFTASLNHLPSSCQQQTRPSSSSPPYLFSSSSSAATGGGGIGGRPLQLKAASSAYAPPPVAPLQRIGGGTFPVCPYDKKDHLELRQLFHYQFVPSATDTTDKDGSSSRPNPSTSSNPATATPHYSSGSGGTAGGCDDGNAGFDCSYHLDQEALECVLNLACTSPPGTPNNNNQLLTKLEPSSSSSSSSFLSPDFTSSSSTPTPSSSQVALGCLTDRGVLISDENLRSPATRDAILELFFETFQVSSLLLCKRAALSAFGCGRTTALIFDCGASCTTAAAVVEGLVLQRALRLSPIAGNWIDQVVMATAQAQQNELLPCYTLKTTNSGAGGVSAGDGGGGEPSHICKEGAGAVHVDPGYLRWSQQHLASCVKSAQLHCNNNNHSSSSDDGRGGGGGLEKKKKMGAGGGSEKKKKKKTGEAVEGEEEEEGGSSYLLPDGTVVDTSVLYNHTTTTCHGGVFPDVLFEEYADNAYPRLAALSKADAAPLATAQQEHNNNLSPSCAHNPLLLPSMSFGHNTSDLLTPLRAFAGFPGMIRSSLLAAAADLSSTSSTHLHQTSSSSGGTAGLSLPAVSDLCQAVIVTGGTSLLPRFVPSLQSQVVKHATFARPGSVRTAGGGEESFRILRSLRPRERQFTSWIGGSIFASLGSFGSHAITRQEYKETGKHIVDRKCP